MHVSELTKDRISAPRPQLSDTLDSGGSANRSEALRRVVTTRLAKGMIPRRCPACNGSLNRSGKLRRPATFVVTYRGDRWMGVDVYHEGCI
jgi:hypothetical protein